MAYQLLLVKRIVAQMPIDGLSVGNVPSPISFFFVFRSGHEKDPLNFNFGFEQEEHATSKHSVD